MSERLTSPHNPKIRQALLLHKKRERDRSGLFLIEGARELSLAVRRGVSIEHVLCFSEAVRSREELTLLRTLRELGVSITEVSGRLFERIAYQGSTGGLVAVARRPDFSAETLPSPPRSLYIVVDSVEKPGNLGAIVRSAEAAGVAGLIVSDLKTDISNPNVIRASLGTVFVVPIAALPSAEAIPWLRARRIRIIASTPHADLPHWSVDMTGACAIVVGSEDRGASDSWLRAADRTVRIPMMGVGDSLNVSAAATILLYEALRQRAANPAG